MSDQLVLEVHLHFYNYGIQAANRGTNRMKITRTQVFARAEALGVEISVEKDRNGRHYHAYAPAGKIFSGPLARARAHNSGLADPTVGETPDWAAMLSEIETVDSPYGRDCDCCS